MAKEALSLGPFPAADESSSWMTSDALLLERPVARIVPPSTPKLTVRGLPRPFSMQSSPLLEELVSLPVLQGSEDVLPLWLLLGLTLIMVVTDDAPEGDDIPAPLLPLLTLPPLLLESPSLDFEALAPSDRDRDDADTP